MPLAFNRTAYPDGHPLAIEHSEWLDERRRDVVSFSHHATGRLEYLMGNLDLEEMASSQIQTMLPVCHREPLLRRLLRRCGVNCTFVARFLDLSLDAEYVYLNQRFVVLELRMVETPRRRHVTCVVPKFETPWGATPLGAARSHLFDDA
jgi:hypothetical protein